MLSNLINSGLCAIYVLVQFKSQSLLRHLREGWQFGGLVNDQFIVAVPAQIRSADAIFQNLNLIDDLDEHLIDSPANREPQRRPTLRKRRTGRRVVFTISRAGNRVWHAEGYNNRPQLAETYESLDNVNSPANMLFSSCLNWGVNPNYGASLYALCPVSSATSDNGTLQSATFNAGGSQYPQYLSFTQTFGYDSLNRLSSVNDSGGYARTFNYDQWGNMWVTNPSGGPWSGSTPTANIFTNNRMNGVSYDASGNQLAVNGNALTYDAENRLASETDGVTGLRQNYVYDGDGQRVQKTVAGGASTTYVYDIFGQLAAEYTTASNTMPCTTCYVAWDHLGSTRLLMDQNGSVVVRHDYLPFGEEVGAGSGRNSQWSVGNDSLAQKFTGKEHDSETGLDFFGARYYGSALGRFTSPDLPFSDQNSSEPQSWNLYTYARNNPLTYIDDTGRAIELSTDSEQRQLQLRALQEALGKRAGSYLYDNVEKDKAAIRLAGILWESLVAGPRVKARISAPSMQYQTILQGLLQIAKSSGLISLMLARASSQWDRDMTQLRSIAPQPAIHRHSTPLRQFRFGF